MSDMFNKFQKTISSPNGRCNHAADHGFTLIELMLVIAVVGTLAAIALPSYLGYKEKARNARAAVEIRMLAREIESYNVEHDEFPQSLAVIERDSLPDPWGNPYAYLKIKGSPKNLSKARKDRFLVPVNSDFDLYSMGKDGKTTAPFTAKASHDDIVRANNGGYVGLAVNY